ncbi:hypothetical protein [Geobacter anodireducens]|uniref:Uncharacterized protein n=1 Tax=Geobacter soli TaxID=1510391 RepID=A0A0C1TT16_9BACT|nr:hypothetical protein [Geobacter soli]KIE42483.1 hypothetical protein SE37_07480 [Geobacter soli]
MLSFRSMTEVQTHKARIPPQIFSHLTTVMEGVLNAYENYDPDNDGYVVLLTPETTNADAMRMIGIPWAEVHFESVIYNQPSRCFVACALCNNQFALSVIVPDAPWLSRLDRHLRGRLVMEMEGKDVE